MLCSELALIKPKLSIIALAETNIESCHGPLYQMSGYNSIYQSKIKDKHKGSGLALYLTDSLEYCGAGEFNHCSKNLEALFVNVTNTSETLTIGVVYRPPSGSLALFLEEYEQLLKKLPTKNVIICGDFNINLHESNENFETLFYGYGYTPTISLGTHEKHGCNATCIDNIFTNSWNTISHTGVLLNRITDHYPIFSLFNLNHSTANYSKSTPKYDTCESNIDKFVEKLSSSIIGMDGVVSESDCIESNFEVFATSLSGLIDECFLVPEKLQHSKRNRLINPWITSGIIASINRKNFLYKRWKKSIPKSSKSESQAFYLEYKNFRRRLKGIIKVAKKSYYSKKFNNFNGDIKKTWGLINELRGKSKNALKPSFIIDGQLVQDRRIICNHFNKYFTSIAKKHEHCLR